MLTSNSIPLTDAANRSDAQSNLVPVAALTGAAMSSTQFPHRTTLQRNKGNDWRHREPAAVKIAGNFQMSSAHLRDKSSKLVLFVHLPAGARAKLKLDYEALILLGHTLLP